MSHEQIPRSADAERREDMPRWPSSPGLREKLKAKSRLDPKTGCLIWLGSTNTGGYGEIDYNGHTLKTHRATWELEKGPIPEGLCVLHKCDNPPCRNIEHLFIGTRANNVEDMVRKNRHSAPRGEAHADAKLTEADIRKIRSLYATGRYRQVDLAERFGCIQAHISRIVRKANWRTVR